ncbi:hypothetical protein LCGC14_1032690, partial [marine sediment metagenome]
MKFHSIYSKGKRKGIYLLISLLGLLFFINLNILSNSIVDTSIREQNMYPISDLNIINEPNIAANEPNGKPLLGYQYANTSKSYTSSILPTNVSFTLQKDWISSDINISFEGVSQKNDRVINGTFDSIYHGWTFKSNDPAEYESYNNTGSEPRSVQIKYLGGVKNKDDYAYFERNISLQEELSSDKIALLSLDYLCERSRPINFTAYLAIIIGDVEVNITYDFPTAIIEDSWEPLTLVYNPLSSGQVLPGNITVRVGIYTADATTVSQWGTFDLDNIQFDLWTMPNQRSIVGIKDLEFNPNSNRTYINTTYGKGYYYNATERSYSENTDIVFTISQNITGIDDFDIDTITITSNLVKRFNSSISGFDGSLYTNGISTTWQTELVISNPLDYINNWARIDKPTDWNITQILDGYDVDRLQNCSGIGLGSSNFTIPSSVFKPGLWKIEATSQNYISEGHFNVGANFMNQSSITFGEEYQINMTLNNKTFSILNTQINCIIEYPNNTIFFEENKTLVYNNTIFGNFTVGNNMSVGTYQVILVWTNNQTTLYRDKVGFLQFEFDVW